MIISSFIRNEYTKHCGLPWTRGTNFCVKVTSDIGQYPSHTDEKYEISKILTASSKILGGVEFRVTTDI